MNISNSQFADACGIPRPTLSQLLNGRNKKISDEIISKIHETYPSLSVLWLLFGEGQMVDHKNTPFSEGLNQQNSEDFTTYTPGNKPIVNPETPQNSVRNSEPNRKNDSISSVFDSEEISQLGKFDLSSIVTDKPDGDGSKKITNIVVFYSDNSFQSFRPSGD